MKKIKIILHSLLSADEHNLRILGYTLEKLIQEFEEDIKSIIYAIDVREDLKELKKILFPRLEKEGFFL